MFVVAIIQARMGSRRLPGKIMREILGKPLLWHLVNRLKWSQLTDKIVIATTDKAQDEPILKLAREMGLDSFAGSEDDVLDRYYQAARRHRAEVVARITADCPLIDPALVDRIIGHYLKNADKLDYVSSGRSYPDGIVETSVFSFTVLEKTWREARWASEREHVTPYIWKNPEIFRIATIENDEDLSYIRLTVDDEKDLQLVNEIFHNLYKEGEVFHLKDIMNLLNRKPELLEWNRDTIRDEGYLKSVSEDKLI